MNNKALIILIMFMAGLLSCSSMNKGKKSEENIVIRYINMRSIYAYLLKRDEQADLLRKKQERLEQEIENDKLIILEGKEDPKKVYNRLSKNRDKLTALAEEEEKHKGKLLNRINIAVKKVAQATGIDFILNIGDEVVFGKKKFDITDDVLKELELLEMRSDPVSR